MTIPPSTETYGRYSLLEKIGQGGMAEVFRAKSFGVEGFEKILVIKRLLPALAGQPRFVEMFVREAKLAVRLSHANVVQVFDLGRVGDSVFIAMEYVHGLDLATLLGWARRRGVLNGAPPGSKTGLSAPTAAYIAAEIAKGLDHAHRRRDEQLRPLGIVHRDVSPQNVLLSFEGEVKVTDFGIAKARDTLGTDVSDDDDAPRADGRISIRGKFAYLAPEQANGVEVDARADIWALGTVLYEMLAGGNPFAAQTTFETLRRVRAAEPQPLELARPDVPPELAAIVRKALTKDPTQRYADAARLHDDLLAYLYSSGERFGGHALGELLAQVRATTTRARSGAVPLPSDLFGPEGHEHRDGDALSSASSRSEEVDVGLELTPVEVPEDSEVVTIPPRGPTSAIAPISGETAAGGLARAASLGERREITALVLELGDTVDPMDGVEIDVVLDADDTGSSKIAPPPRSAPPRTRAAAIARNLHDAKAFLDRYGAVLVEDEPSRLTALFGVKLTDGRDTDIAVRCGLVIARAIRDDAPGFSIGIHAARVAIDASGALTRDDRLAALTSGAIDLARGSEGRVVISGVALKNVRDLIEVEPLSNAATAAASLRGVLIKGRKPPSETYAKFVGRREELRVLGEILAAATRRRARLVTVHGDAGVGKTRLLHEIQRRLQRGAYNVGWYLATCAPHASDVPLSGVAAMLRVLCGIEEGDAESKLISVRPRLRALGLGDEEIASVIELVRTGGRRDRTDDSTDHTRVANAMARMITRLCDDRLHVLAWDDVQSLDPVSLRLLIAVARSVSACRVVLLLSGLPSETATPALAAAQSTASSEKAPSQHLLELGDLARDDVVKLIATRLGVRLVGDDLMHFITERAGGNPLFVEEVLRAMSDAGAIGKVVEAASETTPVPGGPTIERAILRRLKDAIDLPKSLRGLVASRMSRLSTTDRALLLAVALVGEPAEIDLLAATAGDTLAALERSIVELEAGGILRRSGERAVSFVSPVLREVVTDAAPTEAKRELHAAIANALLQQEEPPLDRVGAHLFESGERTRAADFFGRSGEASLAQSKPDAAARSLARALSLSALRERPYAEVARWLQALARALQNSRTASSSGGADATTAIERARERLASESDARLRRDVLIDVGKAYAAIALYDRAKQAFDEAELLSVGDDRVLRAIGMARADLATLAGEFGDAAQILERIEPILARSSSEGPAYYALLLNLALSVAAVGADGARDRALEYLRLAEVEANRRQDTPLLKVDREKTRSLVCIFTRDTLGGATSAERAAELARDAGLVYDTAVSLHNLGEVRVRLGENAQAYATLQQSLALSEEDGHDILANANRVLIAYLDGVAGRETAVDVLLELLAWTQARALTSDEMFTRYWLGLLLVTRRQFALATPHLERSRALATQLGMRLTVSDCEEALARARRG